MPTITYNGVSMESIEENELTQEQFEELKKQYYEKPSKKELVNEIATLISMKGTKMSVITDYYFKDLMAKTKIYFNKWTIEDCFNHKPLLDRFYSKTLINKINNSNVTDEEKKFLIYSAYRHLVFNYSLIAEYYSNASKEMQELMEESALVIIDFKDAIANGYVKLKENISKIMKENGKLANENYHNQTTVRNDK